MHFNNLNANKNKIKFADFILFFLKIVYSIYFVSFTTSNVQKTIFGGKNSLFSQNQMCVHTLEYNNIIGAKRKIQ